MKPIFQTLVIVFSALFLISCTTLNGDRSDQKDAFNDLNLKKDSPEDVIVHQPEQDRPIFSKYERKHWVAVYKKTNSDGKKLFATLATGDWDVAETQARAFLQKHPKDQAALSVLALSLSMQKNYRLAGYYARLLEKYHPASAESLNIRGLALVSKTQGRIQDYRKAADLFYAAFQKNQREIASGLNLGHLYLELGDANAAASIFAEVKARCNECRQSLIGSGIAHVRLKKIDAAKTEFEKVLAKDPNHPQALYRLGLIARHRKNNDEARRYLDRVMVRASEKKYLVRQKAQSLLQIIDYEIDRREIAEESRHSGPKVTDQPDQAAPQGVPTSVK